MEEIIQEQPYDATPVTGDIDIIAVGRRVKQIYPQYAQYPDEQVGLKFVAKYGSNSNVMKSLGVEVKTAGEKSEALKTTGNKRVLDTLFDAYYPEELPPKGLAVGERGFLGKEYGKVVLPLESRLNPSEFTEYQEAFKRSMEASRPGLAKAAGDMGNIAWVEQVVAGKGIADAGNTPGEAFAIWLNAYQRLGHEPNPKLLKQINAYLKENPNEEGVIQTTLKRLQAENENMDARNSQMTPDEKRQVLTDAYSKLNVDATPEDIEKSISITPQTTLKADQFPAASIVGDQQPQQVQPQQQGLLEQILEKGKPKPMEANWLGRLLMPRAAEIQSKQNRGEQVSFDERVGVGGEIGSRAALFAPLPLNLRLALSGGIEGLTTPGEDLSGRLAEGGKKAALGYALGKGGQIIGGGINKGIGALTGSNIAKAGTAREQIAKATTEVFEPKKILEAGENFVKNIPGATKAFEVEKQGLLKNLSAPELLEKIKFWNTAYKESGKVGNTAKAQLYQKLGNTARELLEETAPTLAKAHAGLRKSIQTNELLSKIFNIPSLVRTGIGTGIAAGVGAGAYKLFGGGER
uniref:Uncharacterized protein n=1 Tax=viral metagenome TaxID=1070528 RepID=A0A6M3K7X4_9ZZZZ